MKQCTSCGETLSLEAFGRHGITKDGLSHICKLCGKERQREYAKTGSGIYTALKSRSKFRRSKPDRYSPYHTLSISREDFIMWYDNEPKVCVYCDIPESRLASVFGAFNHVSRRLTVDCKDNERGYEEENLVLACYRCNSTKSDILTFDEMKFFGQTYIKPKWESANNE